MTEFNEEENTARVEAAFRGHPDTWTAKDVLVAEVKRLRGQTESFHVHKCFGYCGTCRETVARAESAEKERDELRAKMDRARADKSGLVAGWIARAEKAEAALVASQERVRALEAKLNGGLS